MKKSQPEINKEDEDLWSEMTKDIKKIDQPPLIEKASAALPEIRNTIDLSQVYSGERLDNLSIGEIANIDRNTAQKFKRGEFKIERRLDLHGKTEKNAYDLVENFIKTSYLQGLRCVLIVTGKGRPHTEEEDYMSPRGILKERVPQWLNNDILRPLILSISYSLPKDGGDGALYILLRRQRDI